MKKILYCPMLYHHDKGMWPPTISSTSYFLWQKNLWNVLSDLKGWKVLWNAGAPNSNLYDPISKWKAENIKYTKMRIQDALKNCDMVLVDVPSTVMWDARKAGKPCLCLAPERDKRWMRNDWWESPSIEIWFESDLTKVKDILKLWLFGFLPTTKNSTIEKLFVINQNDWLKEIVEWKSS